MLALGLTAVLGAAALAADYARAITSRQLLASAADVAVLAAVTGLPDEAAARQIALNYVEKNLPSDKFGKALTAQDIEFGTWDAECGEFRPLSGAGGQSDGQNASSCQFAASNFGAAPTAVRLTTRMSPANGNQLDTLFAWVFGRDSMEVSASAVAARGGPPCLLALNPTKQHALKIHGGADLQTIGCGIQVNSTAKEALDVTGGADLTTENICVGGTAKHKGGGSGPEPNEYCPGMADPMAGLETPEVGPCDHNGASYKGSTVTLNPGVYCGGLDINKGSDITFSPGLYVIQDDPLMVEKSSISGSEVTFFLTGNGAVFKFKNDSSIDLTAPTSGPMEGVLFFQDPASGGKHDWNGKATTSLRGVVYFPSGELESDSENAIAPEGSCLVLIADTIEFGGKGGVSIDITHSNCRNFLPSPYSRGIVLMQ